MDYQDIPGWFDYEAIYDAAVERIGHGETLVEVGTWLGRSTAYMAARIKASGKAVNFYTVDHHIGTNDYEHGEALRRYGGSTFPAFAHYMRECGLVEYIKPLVMDSVAAAHLFDDGSVAFVFIDGGHEYEQVKADLVAWLPKLKAGGVIAGHDIDWPGVARAVNELVPKWQRVNNSWVAG